MAAHIPIRCRCGLLEGRLESPQRATRLVCYCRDCQAFARFLGHPEATLDADGGTEIVAARPSDLHITRGADQLRCMSLSPQGLLRWYTGCCRTAIGNTPRDARFAYVGLIHDVLSAAGDQRDAVFGAGRAAVNTASAARPIRSTPLAMTSAMVKIMRNVLGARLARTTGRTPFFKPGTAEPVVQPQVVSRETRQALLQSPGS